MTLDRNPADYHAATFEPIMLAAFEPNNLVPGIGASPGQAVTRQRAAGPGAQLQQRWSDALHQGLRPTVCAELQGRRTPTPQLRRTSRVWQSDGDMVRSAYTLHADDDD